MCHHKSNSNRNGYHIHKLTNSSFRCTCTLPSSKSIHTSNNMLTKLSMSSSSVKKTRDTCKCVLKDYTISTPEGYTALAPLPEAWSPSASPDISSSDFPFDSGTRKVNKNPSKLQAASTNSAFLTPIPGLYPASTCALS